MPVYRLMHRFKNWFGQRDEKLGPPHLPVTEWLDQSLLTSQDDQRDFHPQRTGRNSVTLRRLSMIGMRIDKLSDEECKCLTTDMCPSATSDPVPCVIHARD